MGRSAVVGVLQHLARLEQRPLDDVDAGRSRLAFYAAQKDRSQDREAHTRAAPGLRSWSRRSNARRHVSWRQVSALGGVPGQAAAPPDRGRRGARHGPLEAADAVAGSLSRELMSHTEIRERGVLFPVPNCPGGQWTGGDPWVSCAPWQIPFSLEGKTAIVTGGGTGIANPSAIEFARRRRDVALCSRQARAHRRVVGVRILEAIVAVAMTCAKEVPGQGGGRSRRQEWGRLDNHGEQPPAPPSEQARGHLGQRLVNTVVGST